MGFLQHTQDQTNNQPPGAMKQGMAAAHQTIKGASDHLVASNNALTAQQIEANWKNQNMALAGLGSEGKSLSDYQSERHVPGFGDSEVPVNENVRDKLAAGVSFQNQLGRFIDWSKSHSGDLSPADIKEGQAMAAGVQGGYRQATNGGIYKAGEQDFIGKIIDSDPTKFFNKLRTIPQLDAVKADLGNQMNDYARSRGLHQFTGYPGSSQEPVKQTKQQSSLSKSGKPIVQNAKGKWVYQ